MTDQNPQRSASIHSKAGSYGAIRPLKAADQVIDSVRRRILSGEFERGTRLPNERQLAKDFGLSQPTIREAVRVLESMSLVEVRHGSGTYVTGNAQGFIAKSLQSLLEVEKKKVGILDIIELRRVIGLHSIELAVDKATDKNLRAIETLEIELSGASVDRDYMRTVEAALCFQTALSAATHNPLLFALESFLIELMLACQLVEWSAHPAQFLETWPNWYQTFYQDRRRLIDALRIRNKKQSVTAMEIYLQDQHRLFSEYKSLVQIDISDPNVLQAVAKAGLTVPAYRDFHELGQKERGCKKAQTKLRS